MCLQLLERQLRAIHDGLKYSVFGSRTWERYLRAQALVALGRNEEALSWFQGSTDGPEFNLPYDAPVHYQRARIYEDLGQPSQAVEHYEKFIMLWRECDPGLRHLVEGAQVRLNALNDQLAETE